MEKHGVNNSLCFTDKTLLILKSMDHYYYAFIKQNIEKYFKAVYELNFIDHSRKYGISATERRIQGIIKEESVYVVLIFSLLTDFELSPLFFQSLKPLAKVVFWFFDDDAFFESASKYFAQAGDAVITTDYLPSFYARYEINAIFATETHSKDVFYPVDIKRDIDVCFVGDCTKSNRMDYINFLLSKGINIEYYGFGSKNGRIAVDELRIIYSRSKIILNFNQIDWPHWMNGDEPMLNRVRQNKGHFTQVALTRSFCLSEFSPGLQAIAEIGKEIDIFRDKPELLEKIIYYLKNDKAREEIAENAYKRSVSKLAADVEFPRVLNELSIVLKESRKFSNPKHQKIYLSRAFKMKSINGLTFSLFILIGLGRFRHAVEIFFRLFPYGAVAFLLGSIQGFARALAVMFYKTTGKYSKMCKK